jgi:heme-degrading monooxygenase HmoA
MISKTPNPPYYAVIFSSQRKIADDGYELVAEQMLSLAAKQSGFLGAETARDSNGFGLTVSYWDSLESIKNWKEHPDHLKAQKAGINHFYENFKVRVCRVER